jgi:outer membrane immunogenic protein
MKKLLLASTCAIALTGAPAFSADLPARMPVKAPVPAPVSYFSWTGCHVGANAGWGWGSKGFSDEFFTPAGIGPATSPVADIQGGLAGGQVGCDYQFAGNWVVGIEGAGDWANIKGSSDPFFGGKAAFSAEVRWIAIATARVGYTWDRWMLYAKGGAAWVGDQYNVPGTFAGAPFNYQASTTRSGWTAGGGIEWAFAPNWSAKFEYDYYDFGTRSVLLFDPIGNFGTAPDPSKIGQRLETVTFGLNYRFWAGPGPIVAKY